MRCNASGEFAVQVIHEVPPTRVVHERIVVHLPLMQAVVTDKQARDRYPLVHRLGNVLWGAEARFSPAECSILKAELERLDRIVDVTDEWALFVLKYYDADDFAEQRDYLLKPDGSVGWSLHIDDKWKIEPRKDGRAVGSLGSKVISGRSVSVEVGSVLRMWNDSGVELIDDRYERPESPLDAEPLPLVLTLSGRLTNLREHVFPDVQELVTMCDKAIATSMSLWCARP